MQRQALRPIIIVLLLVLAVSAAVTAHGNHGLATVDSISMPMNHPGQVPSSGEAPSPGEAPSHCDAVDAASCVQTTSHSSSGDSSCEDHCGAYCSSCQNLFPFRELLISWQKSTFNKIGLHASPHAAYHSILHRPPKAISLNG